MFIQEIGFIILKTENYDMPLLPIPYISNFYVVEIDYVGLFNNLGITGFTPIGGTGNPAKLIASKFEIEHVNSTSPKNSIQGKPGVTVQDVTTPTYKYTIEAPLLIGENGFNSNTGFFPFNSLTYFGLWLSNWQWQQLHGYSTNPSLNSLDYYVIVSSFKINVSENQISQTIVLESNILLTLEETNYQLGIRAQTLQQIYNDFNSGGPQAYTEIINYIGRVARNYDAFANLFFDPSPNSQTSVPSFFLAQEYLPGSPNQTNSSVFLNSYTFEIKFDIDKKYFLNTGNKVVFIIKNYELLQSVDFVGFAIGALDAFNFNPGGFTNFYTTSTVAIGGASYLLFQFTAPLLISTRKDSLDQGQLAKTTLDFKLYGTTYAPEAGSYYLFNSVFA